MEQLMKWEKPTAAVSSQNPQLIALGLLLECHKSTAYTAIIGYYCLEIWTHSPVLQILEPLALMFSPEKTRFHFWSLSMFPAYLGSKLLKFQQ